MAVYKEVTPVTDRDMFVFLDNVNKGFDYPIHNHPEYELTLVSGSAGNRIVGDSKSKYYKLDLVLLGPYIFHKWDDEDLQGTPEYPCRVITIQFAPDLFRQELLGKHSFAGINSLLRRSNRGIRFTGSALQGGKNRIGDLVEKRGMESVTSFLLLLDDLSKTGECEYLASEDYEAGKFPTIGNRLETAYHYILAHFEDGRLKLGDVASALNMSDSAFSHFFKKSTGKSFSQYLIEMRLRHTRNLLLETDEQVSSICYSSGFNNHSNFNRLFKRYYGLTPLQYRKKHQPEHEFDWSRQKAPGQFLPAGKAERTRQKPKEYPTRLVHL